MQNKNLLPFVLKVFVFLPVCYWVWYQASDFTVWAVINLLDPLFNQLLPNLINGIEQKGYRMDILVKATVENQDIPKGQIAELLIPINPLIYNFGLPLCVALILSSPFNLIITIRNIIVSFLLLLPVQIWGIYFETLKILFFQTPTHLIGSITLAPWQLNSIAIGYQLGSLVLPAVIPIIIWLFLYRDFVILFWKNRLV